MAKKEKAGQRKERPKKDTRSTQKKVDVVVQPVIPEPSVHSDKVYPKVDGGEQKELAPHEPAALGTREHLIDASHRPVVKQTKGIFKEMEFRSQVDRVNLRQPFINEPEIVKLGLKHWWPHRRTGNFTTIVGGNRFMLSEEIFRDFKDKGLTLGCDESEAHKYRS